MMNRRRLKIRCLRMTDKPTFFDAVFVILIVSAVIITALCGFHIGLAAPFCFSFILYIFARKDIKDRIIPHHWWLVCVPFCLLGLITGPHIASVIISLIMAGLFFALGFFRVLNGADALALCCMFCCFSSTGIIPISILVLPASFILCGLLMAANKEWRKGVPYLVPLSICCVLALCL